jgi:hypothetical protein
MLHLALLMMVAQAPRPLDTDTQRCSEFTASKGRPDRRLIYIHWLQDFLADRRRSGTTDYLAFHGLGTWLDRYCAANPNASFTTAGSALLVEMHNLEVHAGRSR